MDLSNKEQDVRLTALCSWKFSVYEPLIVDFMDQSPKCPYPYFLLALEFYFWDRFPCEYL